MPLLKKSPQMPLPPAEAIHSQAASDNTAALAQTNVLITTTTSEPRRIGGTRKVGAKADAPMTKDDYWRNREERDIQRDKDMAWSGLAQAAMQSVGLVQLNLDNTLEGFVALVVKATDLLLQARDKRNS